MFFNSLSFAVFLPIVFILYWFFAGRSLKAQNIILLIASYYFYSCWDWRFLFLLAFSTFLDYYTGLKIFSSGSVKTKKFWLALSIIVNLGFLCFFKYYNFFAGSFVEFSGNMGLKLDPVLLNIVLPVGISFYTFHGISYIVDIYNGKLEPTRNWVQYSLFVSFFPLLVAGPIERATHLLPQMEKRREFSYTQAIDGLRQILWGLVKKMVIADNCATYANLIFNDASHYSGIVLIFGALLFTFQIYGDFSGYTDIALGTARLFGFELIKNFNYPYFSRNMSEFWRRWHISLSSWFRDYLYIPLGGSRVSFIKKIRNTFIIFVVSGFWHGANWTFLLWGALNAIFVLPSILFPSKKKETSIVAQGKLFPNALEFLQVSFTFVLTTIAWVFFRASTIKGAFSYLAGVFTGKFFVNPFGLTELKRAVIVSILIIPFMMIEWLGREDNYAIEKLGFKWPKMVRWSFYAGIIFLIGMYMHTGTTSFIYFQF